MVDDDDDDAPIITPAEVYAYVTGVDFLGGASGSMTPSEAIAAAAANLKAQYGSARAAREAIGVSERTFRRWLKGEVTKVSNKSLLKITAATARKRAIEKVRSGGFGVAGEIRVSTDTRPRRCDVGKYIPRDERAIIAEMMERGQWKEAAQALSEAIREHYFPIDGDDLSLYIDEGME